jgi:hypothetical protein
MYVSKYIDTFEFRHIRGILWGTDIVVEIPYENYNSGIITYLACIFANMEEGDK